MWGWGENYHAQSYHKNDYGIVFSKENTTTEIKFYSSNIVRIIKYPIGKPSEKNSLSVIKKEQKTQFSVSENKNVISLKTADLQIFINPENGKINFKSFLLSLIYFFKKFFLLLINILK